MVRPAATLFGALALAACRGQSGFEAVGASPDPLAANHALAGGYDKLAALGGGDIAPNGWTVLRPYEVYERIVGRTFVGRSPVAPGPATFKFTLHSIDGPPPGDEVDISLYARPAIWHKVVNRNEFILCHDLSCDVAAFIARDSKLGLWLRGESGDSVWTLEPAP